MSLQQCFAQIRLDKLVCEEEYASHCDKWQSFITSQKYPEDFARTDATAFEVRISKRQCQRLTGSVG